MEENPWYEVHSQAYNGNIQGLEVIVKEAFSQVNAISVCGRTPLFLSAAKGHVKTVAWLLKHGANVNHSNHDGLTALHYAAASNQVEVVKLLITQGGANHQLRDRWGRTPLIAAVYAGHLEAMSLLLRFSRDFEAVDSSGQTILMKACKLGHTAMVMHLLQQGADPCSNEEGEGGGVISPMEYVMMKASTTASPTKKGHGQGRVSGASSYSSSLVPIFQEWERNYLFDKIEKMMGVWGMFNSASYLPTADIGASTAYLPCADIEANQWKKMVPRALHRRLCCGLDGGSSGSEGSKSSGGSVLAGPAQEVGRLLPYVALREEAEGEEGWIVKGVAHHVLKEMNQDVFGELMELMGLTSILSNNTADATTMDLEEEEEELEVEEEW